MTEWQPEILNIAKQIQQREEYWKDLHMLYRRALRRALVGESIDDIQKRIRKYEERLGVAPTVLRKEPS